jgi:hypothetical protein
MMNLNLIELTIKEQIKRFLKFIKGSKTVPKDKITFRYEILRGEK